MNISQLIDRHCTRVSILEDTRQVAEWLRDKAYFAVVDEELQVVGLFTQKDVFSEKGFQLIDCSFAKPGVSPTDTPEAVFEIMAACGQCHLPVYGSGQFIGAVSLLSLTAGLIRKMERLEGCRSLR